MSAHNLSHLLAPKSVALVGASERPASVGATIARNLLAARPEGPVYFVNPKHAEIAGKRCYRDLAALPQPPDLAVICTPAQTVAGLLTQLGEAGCKAAIVISAGPHDGPFNLDVAVKEIAERYEMRVLGPNCIGLIVPGAGLNASFAHIQATKGDLALVSQSGAILTSVLDWAKPRGIGFSHLVSLGDMADVDVADVLDQLAMDRNVRAILLYLEGVRGGRDFVSAARAAARIKPVVVLKTGRHADGARAAASHTGAMAGSDSVYDAVFARTGLVRVPDLGDLFSAAEVLSRFGRLTGERLAILTNGGGAGVLAVDRLADFGGKMAAIAPATIAALDAVLPTGWSRANPLDIIGDAGPERYAAAYRALLEDEGVDCIAVLNCPTAVASSTDAAGAVAELFAKAKAAGRAKPTFACWLGADAAADGRKLLEAAGLPSFETPAAAIEGFGCLVDYRRAQAALLRAPTVGQESAPPPDRATAAKIVAGALAENRELLNEAESKAVLAAYGIPVAATRMAATPAEVGHAAAEVIAAGGPGTQVVVKIWSRNVSHKSDVGGVRLGLVSSEEAVAAATAMLATVARIRPDAQIDGFMVQQMIRREHAHELIVGVAEDATFGPIVLFGAGGTGVEAINDKALALPPLDPTLALELIGRTRINRLLAGYRDRPPADRNAIAGVLCKIADLAAEVPEIRELDINPLIADTAGVMALDARILVRPATNRDRFAIRPYPAALKSEVKLLDGASAVLRPVKPEDERLATDFFAKLNPEDVRMRLLAPLKRLTPEFVARLTQIDYAREMAFVAVDASGALLGIGRLSREPDGQTAEFGIIVRSDLKGKGLGWLLMQKLIAYGRSEGVKRIDGHVLVENTTMLQMCRELGFESRLDPDDTRLRLVRLPLS